MYNSISDTALLQQLTEQVLNLHAIDKIVANLEHSDYNVSSIYTIILLSYLCDIYFKYLKNWILCGISVVLLAIVTCARHALHYLLNISS